MFCHDCPMNILFTPIGSVKGYSETKRLNFSSLFGLHLEINVLSGGWFITVLSGWLSCLVLRMISTVFKPAFHTCVSMYGHQCSQAITAFATKACEVATKLHFCEGLRSLCRDMLWLWSIETSNARNKEDFCPPKTKSKAKNKEITTTFGKSLFLIKYRKRYTIYMPPNTKDLAINQPMIAYGNRQNATAFAWANNSDLLRSLKHLMKTRL